MLAQFADTATAPTLAIGDFLIILGMVVGAAVFMVWRLASVPAQIKEERRAHEEHCANYHPVKSAQTAPRGVRAMDTLEDFRP